MRDWAGTPANAIRVIRAVGSSACLPKFNHFHNLHMCTPTEICMAMYLLLHYMVFSQSSSVCVKILEQTQVQSF